MVIAQLAIKFENLQSVVRGISNNALEQICGFNYKLTSLGTALLQQSNNRFFANNKHPSHHIQILMDNLETLSIVSFAATVLSLVAVVIVFVLYTFVPQIRSNLFFRLGFHISLSDFIFGLSSAYLKAPEDPSYLCQSLGGIREFAWLGSILWTTILTRNMYHFVRHSTSEEELSDKRTYYVILGYFPSLIVLLSTSIYR